jgi:hypothetical protein
LAPGEYQLRASGESTAMRTGGSVYLVIDVPDPHAMPLTLGGLLLGYATTPPIAAVASGDAKSLPFLPTADRTFLTSDVLRLLCEFSRGTGVVDVEFLVEALDQQGGVVRTATTRVASAAAPRLDARLPLQLLAPGAYLLRVTATSGSIHASREVGIRVR